MVAFADRHDGIAGNAVGHGATDSPYHDWPEVYNEERQRGRLAGVDAGVRLGGHVGIRGTPDRPDASTRRRPRYKGRKR